MTRFEASLCPAGRAGHTLGPMRSRGAIAAVALIGAVLAVMAASAGGHGGGIEGDLGLRSVLASVLITLGGLFLLAVLVLFWMTLAKKARGDQTESVRQRAPLVVQLAVLAFIAGLLALIYFLVLHGAHPHRPVGARLGGAPPERPLRATKTVPFNMAASSTTVAVVLAIAALVLFRRRIWALFRRPRPLHHFEKAAATPDEPAPLALASSVALPDPAAASDPRQAVVLAYQRFVLVMARRGYSRLEPETAFEYEHRLTRSGPITADADRRAARALTEMFASARYGRAAVSEETRQRAIGTLAALENHLSAT